MATPDVRKVLRVNGRMCWNPTDLSGTYPFSGTALGAVTGAALKLRAGHHVIRGEEYGGAACDAVYTSQEVLLSVVLSAWDADALSTVTQDSGAGATTARRVMRYRPSTEAVRAGSLVSANAGVLYFSPDSDAYPGVLFRSALPMLAENGSWPMNLGDEFGVPVIFLAVPNSSGDVYEVGLREDLTL